MELEISNVQLDARVASKAEAIHKAANLLVNSQYIKPGYIDSMLAREKVANTYLGNGISIPHGLPKDRDLILRTGIAVLQVEHDHIRYIHSWRTFNRTFLFALDTKHSAVGGRLRALVNARCG